VTRGLARKTGQVACNYPNLVESGFAENSRVFEGFPASPEVLLLLPLRITTSHFQSSEHDWNRCWFYDFSESPRCKVIESARRFQQGPTSWAGANSTSSSSISAQAINCRNLFCKLEWLLHSFQFSKLGPGRFAAAVGLFTRGSTVLQLPYLHAGQNFQRNQIIAYCLTLFRVVCGVWNSRSPTSYQLG